LPVGVAALAEFGYRDMGGRCYRRGDVVLDARGPWWTFRCPAPSPALTPEDGLGRPGLWKIADQLGAVQVCDLPARALGLDAADLTGLLSWVEATRSNPSETPGHEPVPEESGEIQAVDPRELTARVGPFTCQGKVMSEGSRLWVDYPLAAFPDALPDALPDEQSETRQRWLQAILIAARGLAMVRVERASSTETIHVRVDLTGVPPVWRGPLLTQGTACLRSAVESLLPSITFLTTAGVTCRAMELGSLAPNLKEKR
jgi:hypothetical protein